MKLAGRFEYHGREPADGICLGDPIVFARLAHDVADRAVADTAYAHSNHDARNVRDIDSRGEQEAQHAVVVGCDSIAGIESTKPFVDRPANVERWMRRHPPAPQRSLRADSGAP